MKLDIIQKNSSIDFVYIDIIMSTYSNTKIFFKQLAVLLLVEK